MEMRCLIPDLDSTPSTAYDRSGRDLLGRLLEPNPQQRLRSLYALERIAMYKNYSFADVRNKKVRLEVFFGKYQFNVTIYWNFQISPLKLIAEASSDKTVPSS